jgi:hypothetical protein
MASEKTSGITVFASATTMNGAHLFGNVAAANSSVFSTAGGRADGVFAYNVHINGKPTLLLNEPGMVIDVIAGVGGLTDNANVAVGANGTAVNAVATNVIVGKARKTVAAGQMAEVLFYGYGGIA